VGSEEHDEREDEPRHEVDAEGVGELGWAGVGGDNASAGDEDESIGDPEATVRGEGSRTEGVAASKLPHASEELNEASNADGHADDNVGRGDTASADVVEREDEGGGREGEQSKRGGVGKLPVVDGESGLAVGEGVGKRLSFSVTTVVGTEVRASAVVVELLSGFLVVDRHCTLLVW